uniref:Reverse transcriptase domain-containing protein n=1 Tax=Trichuris muris TaxID=70415 RepID=A0A5S6Q2K1_TRIMR
MSHVSHIEEFDVSNPAAWQEYAERLEFYLAANGIRDAQRKLAVLCSACGQKTYSVIRSLTSPEPPSAKSYGEVMRLLEEHFSPKPSEIYSRFQYQRRFQQASEGVAAFVAELRQLAQHCNFGDTLESRLRDLLVCCLRDETLQKQLLTVKDLTLATAIDRALSAEAASVQVAEMRSPMATTELIGVKRLSGARSNRDGHTEINQRRRAPSAAQPRKPCHRCGGPHSPMTCQFRNAACNYCKRTGHIERACWSKRQFNGVKHNVTPVERNTTNCVTFQADEYKINRTACSATKWMTEPVVRVKVKLNGVSIDMEVDSGASFTVLSESVFKRLSSKSQSRLEAFPQLLCDFQGHRVHVLGAASLNVEFGTYSGMLTALIVKGQRSSLLGRNWFKPLGICVTGIHKLERGLIDSLVAEYADLFTMTAEAAKVPPVMLHVDPSVPPIKMSARRIPFALRERVSQEIDKLVRLDILEPVEQTDWTTPIVPIIKDDGIKKDLCQIPAVNDILATLKKGNVFAKLDLAQAYLQLPVNEASARLQTIVTHKGAFMPKRLQFGIASATAIFQKFMDTLLLNLEGVIPYFDDVLIVGENEAGLVSVMKEVFQRLRNAGIRLKREKCVLGAESVTFLGYCIDAQGIHPTEEKVQAIHNAPRPSNKLELQSFLGLLNFYHHFLPNKAEIAEPLHRLLDKGRVWKWTREHERAFEKFKTLISSHSVLVQYDDKLPLTLTCDASPHGIGCVLAHKLPEGTEAPIAFHSRTLTAAERNYAQIDREALSILAGIKKFYNYVYGRPFEVKTDHKPLLGLLDNSVQTSTRMSPRMIRWSIALSAYDYKIVYRPGKQIGNADALSRLPQPGNLTEVPPPLEVLLLESMTDPPITAKQIAEETTKDPVLSQVRD